MVDIASTVPAAAASSTAAQPALTPVQVTIADITQALSSLSYAVQTNAVPVAAPTGDTLTLATSLGQVTITLPQLSSAEQQTLLQQLTTLAQTQRPLTLSLQPGSPPTQAVLLLPATPIAASTPTIPATQSLIASPSPPLTAGQTLPAIVLPALDLMPAPLTQQPVPIASASGQQQPEGATTPTIVAAEPTISQPQTSPQQSSLSASISQQISNASASDPAVSLSPPTSLVQATTPAIQSVIQQIPVGTPAAPPQTAPTLSTLQTAPTIAALLKPGNEVSLTIDAVLPPEAPPPMQLAPNQITAKVVGFGTGGQVILKAGDTTLFVKDPVSAPVGTNVIVSVGAAKPPVLITLPAPAPSSFASLPQAIAALAVANPQVLQQILTHLPQPSQMLPGTLLALLSAFKQGNLRGWLGDEPVDTLLRAGKSDIVTSLSRDLSDAGQTAQDGVVGEWHSYPIPLYSQQQFQALTLYVHNEGGRGKSQKDNSPRRRRQGAFPDRYAAEPIGRDADGRFRAAKKARHDPAQRRSVTAGAA